MDDLFKKLETEGKTNVNDLVQWMTDSKLIDKSKEAELKAKDMFKDAKDSNRIELKKFKDVINKLALEKKKSADQLSQQLVDHSQSLMKATIAGVDAVKKIIKDGK